MQFIWLGNTIHLQGLRENNKKEISSSQLKGKQVKAISALIILNWLILIKNNLPNVSTLPSILAPFSHLFRNLKSATSLGAFTPDSIDSTFLASQPSPISVLTFSEK